MGPPVPVIDHVRTESLHRAAQYSVSDEGTLVYASGKAADIGKFVIIDQKGLLKKSIPLPEAAYGTFALSPDGQKLAYTLDANIWIYDMGIDQPRILTLQGNSWAPNWLSDGEKVAFSSDRNGHWNLFVKSEGEAPKSLSACDCDQWLTSVSFDGKYFLYDQILGGIPDIGVQQMHKKAEPFLTTESTEWGARFSPNGKYVAYTSDESGKMEVYVKPFSGGDRWQISTGGGEQPIWSPKGDKLYYRSLENKTMVVDARIGESFTHDKPGVLFEGNYLTIPGLSYDIYPDGEHFLMLKATNEVTTLSQLNIVTNWFEELKLKVPVEN